MDFRPWIFGVGDHALVLWKSRPLVLADVTLTPYSYREPVRRLIENQRNASSRVIYLNRSVIVGRGASFVFDGKSFVLHNYVGQVFSGVLEHDQALSCSVDFPQLRNLMLPYFHHRSGFRLERWFDSKEDLDRAFPAGEYRFSTTLNGDTYDDVVDAQTEFGHVELDRVSLCDGELTWPNYGGQEHDWIRVLIGKPDGTTVFKTPAYKEPGYLTPDTTRLKLDLPPGEFIGTAVFYRNSQVKWSSHGFSAAGSYKRFKFCLSA